MPDLLQTFLVSIVGGLATGITGLFGLSFTQRYTDNRKLVDTTLTELESIADECAKQASGAWNQQGNPQAPEVAETIALLHDISNYVTFIKQRVPNAGLRLNSPHLNFRRAATGDDFDVAGRPADPGRVSDIRSKNSEFKMACRSVIFERNKIGLPFFGDD